METAPAMKQDASQGQVPYTPAPQPSAASPSIVKRLLDAERGTPCKYVVIC